MKIKDDNIFLVALLCLYSLLHPERASAVSCSAGQYPYLSWCHGCAEGCYCTGPGFYQGGGYLNSCNPDKSTIRFGALVKNSGWNDVYTCPSKFPKSAPGAKSAEDCYADIGGKKVYNKSIKLTPGNYLPVNSDTATKCKTTGNRYYCPGGMTVTPSFDRDQGIKECPSGKQPNSTQTGCISSSVTCKAGQYLPKNATNCKDCSGRYYVCTGGTFAVKQSFDQGIRKCDGAMIANAEHTACISENTTPVSQEVPNIEETPSSTSIHAEPGFYLPANKSVAVTCSGVKKYCPGGDYDIQPVDQGIFDCPLNGRANATKSACTITLTKDQMKFGPLGIDTTYSRQCWQKTSSADEFKSCIFGIRLGSDSE